MKAEFLDCRLCMIFHGNCGSLLLTIERETRDTDYKESCFSSHFIHVCTFVICLKQRNWGPKGRGSEVLYCSFKIQFKIRLQSKIIYVVVESFDRNKIVEDYWNRNNGFINAICQNTNKQDIFSEFLNTDI